LTLDENGKMTVVPVITGLVGTSSTQIVAGNVKVGDEVAVPITTALATSTGTTSSSGTLGSGGFGAAALSGAGGGGGRFFRGGG
jgi:hypothetical protein